jgi:hypothetical protein
VPESTDRPSAGVALDGEVVDNSELAVDHQIEPRICPAKCSDFEVIAVVEPTLEPDVAAGAMMPPVDPRSRRSPELA